jgi:surface antigen
MKKIMVLVVIGFLTIGLSACATREEAGTLTGAAVGAAVGSTIGGGRGRALAIWLGAVVGAHIGQTIGRYMDEQDRIRTSMVLESNRTYQPSTWHNPDTGYDYTVTPTRTYEVAEGPCREFTVNAIIGGKTEQVYGTACRQADGSWKIIK